MGIKLNEAFPSKYLKADDLRGQNVRVVIREAVMEELGSDHRLIVYFQGKDKGLVCNKTNAESIAFAYGDDTDMWIGQTIELFGDRTMFQGKMVPCLRVRATRPSQQRQPAREGQTGGGNTMGAPAGYDDDIPFAPVKLLP